MKNIRAQSEAYLPTKLGSFKMVSFAYDKAEQMPHIVLYHPDMDISKPVYIRIHSECLTGDVFHSLRCDCGEQLEESLRIINQKKGMLIYLRQEGRGIGIVNKLKAYNLQDDGLDTVQANVKLGFDIDERKYDASIEILRHYEIDKVYLITNNPDKINALENSNIQLMGRIPIVIEANENNALYLQTKKDILHHKI